MSVPNGHQDFIPASFSGKRRQVRTWLFCPQHEPSIGHIASCLAAAGHSNQENVTGRKLVRLDVFEIDQVVGVGDDDEIVTELEAVIFRSDGRLDEISLGALRARPAPHPLAHDPPASPQYGTPHDIAKLGDGSRKSASMTNRLLQLDVLRAMAALLVLIFHFEGLLGFVPPDGWPVASDQRFYLGLTGVELFFVISGMVILLTLERTGSGWQFAVGRLARLYPGLLGFGWAVRRFSYRSRRRRNRACCRERNNAAEIRRC